MDLGKTLSPRRLSRKNQEGVNDWCLKITRTVTFYEEEISYARNQNFINSLPGIRQKYQSIVIEPLMTRYRTMMKL
jgi:hypothetical protein